ncbi:hypothetical protein QWY84_00140 [Aquisalimonas lutea]|uniref:hypothetical protein n=1 Tax=Aquisalimonas lutea TaxID=1327750 RepID=UPI0025B3DEA0|nr:hypothetical protein [Aquisalimonas lutea]MDN3516006.1 hypothetical protein [Aquisalimonas lutea]
MSEIFPGSAAFHEPDGIHRGRVVSDAFRVISEFGIYRGLLGKIISRTGVRNINNRYLAGRLSDEEAAEQIAKNRTKFYRKVSRDLIIESNYALYGLLPVIEKVFLHYNVAAIVREPESWIRSYWKRGDRYGKKDYLQKLNMRISPEMIGDKKTAIRWGRMHPIERIAWFWHIVYTRIKETEDDNKRVRVFRFEDIFNENGDSTEFVRLAEFLGAFDDRKFSTAFSPDILSEKLNSSPDTSVTEEEEKRIKDAASTWCYPFAERWGYRL